MEDTRNALGVLDASWKTEAYGNELSRLIQGQKSAD